MLARGPLPRTEQQRKERRKFEAQCAASFSNPVPSDVIDGLTVARPSLATATSVERQGLAYMAWCGSMPHRRHRLLPSHFSVHNVELEQRFGRNGFKRLNAEHDLFEVVSVARPKLTDAYRLKTDVDAALTAHIRKRNQYGAPVTMIRPDSKPCLSLPMHTIARNGLPARSPWRGVNVNGLVPVDEDALARLDAVLMSLSPLPPEDQRARLETLGHYGQSDAAALLRSLTHLRRMTRVDISGTGLIAHEYHHVATGRVFAKNANLQGAPKIIKRAALNGLHAHDFSNCHFTIIHQLAAHQRLDLPTVADLLKRKDDWRTRLGAHCDMPAKTAKLAFIRLGYGASRYLPWDDNEEQDSITELIGPERSALFYSHPDVRQLKRELAQARRVILGSWPLTRGKLVNSMRLRYDPDPEEDDTAGKQLAHILQGYEARMLCTVVSMFPDDVLLLEHDGWTSRTGLDADEIVGRIHAETGLRMTLEQEQIVAPC